MYEGINMRVFGCKSRKFIFLDFFNSKEILILSNKAKSICEEENLSAYYMFDTYSIEDEDGRGVEDGLVLFGICLAEQGYNKYGLLEEIQKEKEYAGVTVLKELSWFYEHLDSFGGVNVKDFEVRQRIKEYVNKKNAYKNFDKEVRSRILGQPDVAMITYNVFLWLKNIAYNKKIKNNMIVAGPSGSGKTETYRVIEEILSREIGERLPVIRLDLSMLTTEGFQGMDNREFFRPLIEKSCNGIAIVVLDEMDKKMIPNYSSSNDNVNQNVQSQILTIIEGIELSSEKDKPSNSVDTNNTLFIGAGTFEYLRKKRETVTNTIGFNREENNSEIDYNDGITMEDIVSIGAINELIGRFTTVVNFRLLSRDDINILVKRYADEYSELLGYDIKVSSSAVDIYYEQYCMSKFGCRILRSNLYNQLIGKCREIELMSKNEKETIKALLVTEKGVYIQKYSKKKSINVAV